MGISRFFNLTATIERMAPIPDTKTRDWSEVGTTPIGIHPINPENQIINDMRFSALFKAFMPIGVNIKEGDRLKVDGEIYIIHGIQRYAFVRSSNQYVYATLGKPKA